MPCEYRSIVSVEIKDRELLKKALARMGFEGIWEYPHQRNTIAVGPSVIRIEAQTATVTSPDPTFANRLKANYGVEAAKKELKKRGYRYKEIQEGSKIRLVVQG